MKPATLARLALAGTRTDRLRTALTAGSAALAALALLAAATVAAVAGRADRYTSALLVESGLRPGVVTALVLLSLPVLALAGQCIRLGAPARDRRLAAIRLAGATPRQAVLIASAETAVAAFGGSLVGYAVFLVLRRAMHRPGPDGLLPLPTDVLPSVLATVLLLVAPPVVAGLVGALLLRRVVISPLGVVRRTRDRRPRPWPGVLIAVALLLFVVLGSFPEVVPNWDGAVLALLTSGVVAAMAGVVLGTAWISYVSGRLLVRAARRPALILAGRRLLADPWSGSRTFAALLAGVIAGAIALGYGALLRTEMRAMRQVDTAFAADEDFYLGALRLVLAAVGVGIAVAVAGILVALTEGIVGRRRTYAAMTAAGVPRRVLGEAMLWHSVVPLLPAMLVALGVGIGLVRLLATDVRVMGGPDVPEVVLPVPVPWADLAVLGGGVLLAMLAAVGAGLFVLRSSTDLEELRAG